jgi:hypothetical protein
MRYIDTERQLTDIFTKLLDSSRFADLGLKTGIFDLVIWASKSPRQFLGLSFKIKWTSIYRLCHKTDGGRSMRDTRRDLAVCFTWKQVWLGFSNLA